jgi:hypothetical protein
MNIVFPEKIKWIGRKILGIESYKTKRQKVFALSFRFLIILSLVFILISEFLPAKFFQPSKVSKEPEKKGLVIEMAKKDFNANEDPEFLIKGQKEEKAPSSSEIKPKLQASLVANATGKDVLTTPIIEKVSDSDFKIKIQKPEDFRPGVYKLKVEYEGEILEQDFRWGVLAINTNKSIYLPGEQIYLQMVVLNEYGHTICNAKLELTINNQILSTENGQIQYSDSCGYDNVTDTPDYFAYYQINTAGTYQMTLKNLDNGFEINDSFEVKDSVPFEIERIGATRVNPYVANYIMTLNIKANQDFNGEIIEKLPGIFEVIEAGGGKVENTDLGKEIAWEVNLKAGDEITRQYEYDAPDLSPRVYLFGPLRLVDTRSTPLGGQAGQALFAEARQWQIATDATCTCDITAASKNWSDTTIWGAGCASTYPGRDANGDIVTIANSSTTTARTLTLDVNLTTYTLASITFTAPASNLTLLHGAGNSLTTTGDVTINPGTGNNDDAIWAIGAQTATVGGNVSFPHVGTTHSRTAQIQLTTAGVLNINGNLVIAAGEFENKILNISGGTGVTPSTGTGRINLKGTNTNLANGNLIAGTSGSIFNYNGSSAAQTITMDWGGTNLEYNNLYINNTHANGATLGAAITDTLVTGNVIVGDGSNAALFKNGGFAIDSGGDDTFQVQNGAFFEMSATSAYPTLFATFTFGATSTVRYLQTGATTIAVATYGHLEAKPSASSITFTFAAGSPVVAGNFTTGVNDGYTGAQITAAMNATILDVNGNVTIGANSTFIANGANNMTVGGSWANSGAFTHSSRTVVFDAGSNSKTINPGGSSFNNVQFNNASGGWTATTNTMTIAGTLTVTAGSFDTGAVTNAVTGATSISITGTLTISSLTNTKTFGNITINTGGTMNFTAAEDIVANGNLQVDGTGTISGTQGTWAFQKAGGGGTLSGTATSITLTNATFTTSYANSGTYIISNTLTVTGTTLTNNGTLTVTSSLTGTGGLTQGSSATLNLAGTCDINTLDATVNPNTVNYTGAGQTVKPSITYHHLTLSGSGTPVLTNVSTINGNLTLSGGVTPSTGANTIVGGNISVGTGTSLTVVAANTLAVTGSVAVTNTGTIANNSTGGFTISTDLTGTGGLTQGTNSVLNVAGTVSISSLDANASGNTVNYTGSSQTVKAVIYHHLTLSGSNTPVLTNVSTINGNLTLSGTVTPSTGANTTVGGSISVGTGTSLTVAAANTLAVTGSVAVTSTGTIANNSTGGFTISTDLTGTGGLTQGTNSVLNVAGTVSISSLDANASGNTVNYTGSSQTVKAVIYHHLTLSGSGAKTITSLATINGNFTVSGTATATTAAAITIGGNLDVSTTGAGGLTLAGYDFSVAGTTSVTGILTNSSATGTKTFTGDVTISGVSSNWNETAAAVINFGGSLANSANSWTGSTGTHTFTGSDKTINGSTTTTIPNVSVSGTVTNNGTMTVSTTLAGNGGFTNGATGTLNFGGSTLDVTTFTASASGNTVNYNSITTDQTIRGTTYHHLTIDKTGRIATLGGATIVNGDLNITNGTLDAGDGLNYAINVKGDWTNNGSFTARNGTVTFSGADSSTQKIQGSANTSFYDFTASTSGNSSGRTLQFKGSSTTIVSGTWTITGYSGKVIILESSDTNSWTINPTAASVTYVNVSRSTNSGVYFCATYSTNGGNNSSWAISGTSNCGKYLTSCWSGSSNSCSDDSYSDDVIGALWYRSDPTTMWGSKPYDVLNYPPLHGSWYAGMLPSGIEVTINGTSISFAELTITNNFSNTASTPTEIIVTTGAASGYIVTAWETQVMTHNDYPSEYIDNFKVGADYCIYPPADTCTWSESENCINNNKCGFGFTSSDTLVDGVDRYHFEGQNKFAGFPDENDPARPILVMDWPSPVSGKSFSITYRISTSLTQRPGTYGTTIVYIVTAQY